MIFVGNNNQIYRSDDRREKKWSEKQLLIAFTLTILVFIMVHTVPIIVGIYVSGKTLTLRDVGFIIGVIIGNTLLPALVTTITVLIAFIRKRYRTRHTIYRVGFLVFCCFLGLDLVDFLLSL